MNNEYENENEEIYSKQPTRSPNAYLRTLDEVFNREKRTTYAQYFIHDNFASASKTPIMAMMHSGAIDEDDIKILEALYDFRFLVMEQLVRYCDIKGIENGEERVNILVKKGIINAFFIALKDKKNKGYFKKPDDALLFYCLTDGARYLLEGFTDRLYIIWEAGDNIANLKKIEKFITINEIYLDIITSKAKLLSSWSLPEFAIGQRRFKADVSLCFASGNNENEYMLFDTIRASDKIEDVLEKIRFWEDFFVKTNYWKKYYIKTSKMPMLVFITDNDNTAFSLAQNIAISSKLNVFLITTLERTVKKALEDTGRFIKYNREDGKLYEISYGLFSK